MKKIIALLMCLVMVLSLCACGANPADNAGTSSDSAVENQDSNTLVDSADTDKSEETGYVGTWKVIPPDENDFPPLYLVLNEDGTAGWGAKLDNLDARIWYECDEEDAKEGQMELSREDNKGYGDDFYLTEDGKIYMEVNLNVQGRSYDHVYFERQ